MGKLTHSNLCFWIATTLVCFLTFINYLYLFGELSLFDHVSIRILAAFMIDL